MSPNDPRPDLGRTETLIDHRLSQSIFDTLTSHIAVVDENGVIVVVNKAWTEFAAANGNPRPASTGVGANYLDVARHATGPYSEEGQAAYLGIKAVLNGSLPQFTLEYPCHSDSVKRWFLLTVSPLAGTPIKAVLSHLDISLRRDMENKLRESEGRLRELALHIPQALWVVDTREDRVTYISPGYETIWGRSCQSLLDSRSSYMEGIHPLDHEKMSLADAVMIETGHLDVEVRILRPDESIKWAWIQGYAVKDDMGAVVRVVGVVEDITERKAAEDDQARLAAIVECSEDAIVSITLAGVIVTWNQGAERLYGYSIEEILGQSNSVLFPPRSLQRIPAGPGISQHRPTGFALRHEAIAKRWDHD